MYRKMAKHYDDIFPAGQKIRFLKRMFEDRPAGHLLDIGCSNGSVAHGLAAEGFRVDAIDLSEAMIAEAERIPAGATCATATSTVPSAAPSAMPSAMPSPVPRAAVRRMNMLDVARHFPRASFDGLYCIGNTLVHLEDAAMIGRALAAFREVAKPSGRLVVQILDYAHILATRPDSLPRISNEHVDFVRRYRYLDRPEGVRIEFATTLTVDPHGEREVFTGSEILYPLTLSELESLLDDAGFQVIDRFGSYAGEPYRPEAPTLIVVAEAV